MKKINKLLLISASVLASSVVLGGCGSTNEQKESEAIVEVDKFDLAFMLDDTFEVIDTENFTLDENGYASIEKGTQVKFKIKVNEGVKLDKSGLIVKVNDNEIGDFDGVYQVTVNKDLFVTVSGFAEEENVKHRVKLDAPYGVSLISEGHESFPDGSFLLSPCKFEFSVEFLPGFVTDNFEIKANGAPLTAVDGKYSIDLTQDYLIKISGVKYEQLQVEMKDSNLFSFKDITGATLKDGIAYVSGELISFKIQPSILADMDNSEIVVKNGGEILTPTNGVYSITPTSGSKIEVSGLKAVTAHSDKTGKTWSKEVLNNCAFTTIVTTNGAVVSGEANDKADIDNGYKKATFFAGEYGTNQLSLNSNEILEKYEYIEFEVNPFTNDYIEFYEPITNYKNAMFHIRDKGWTKISLRKGDDGFHYFVGSEDKGLAAYNDTLISALQFRIQGSYLVSELVCLRDPDYIDPHYYSDIKALDKATYVEGKDEETEFGTKKWYEITDSSYGVAHNFSSLNPEKYTEMAFEIMPIGEYDGGPWFGLNAAGSTGGFTKDTASLAIFTKDEVGKWTLTLKGKSTTEFKNLDLGTDLNTTKLYLHPNKGKVTFLVSNFRFVDDPEYDEFGQKTVNVVGHDLDDKLTYSIEGQSTSTFKVDADTDIKLTLDVASGYDGVVKVNGDVVKGNDNVYTIKITRTTTIDIYVKEHHDIVKLLDTICDGQSSTPISDNCFTGLDPEVTTVYKNNKSGGTLYPSKSCDLTGLNYLYFYCWNKENTQLQLYPGNSEHDCTTLAKKGDKFMVEIKREDGKWNFYLGDTLLEKLSGKETNNLEALFYLQFWGTIYLSPLFAY